MAAEQQRCRYAFAASEIAALIMIPDTAESLDAAATKWVRARLDDYAVAIKNTTGATRDAFQRVLEQTITPEAVTIALRDNLSVATVDGDGAPLPTFERHIYCDGEGLIPAAFNSWETDVIRAEASHASFVGWYRNPSRATPAALRIAYQNDAGVWTSVQPDFIVVSQRDDDSLAASIIDPHGDHFADALNKLLALADYAEDHGEQFVRIESITKTGDELRYLDLTDEAVRERIRSFEGAEVASLYESDVSSAYHAASSRTLGAEPATSYNRVLSARKNLRHICRSCGPPMGRSWIGTYPTGGRGRGRNRPSECHTRPAILDR